MTTLFIESILFSIFSVLPIYFSFPNLVILLSYNIFIFSFFERISETLNISILIKFKNINQLQLLFAPNLDFIILLYLSKVELDLISLGKLL